MKRSPKSRNIDDGGLQSLETQIQRYEVLFELAAQLFSLQDLEERLSMALDILVAEFGFTCAAIGLVDRSQEVLRIRQTVGLDKDLQGFELPLQSKAASIRSIHEPNPVWILRGTRQYAPLLESFPPALDVLVLPFQSVNWVVSESGPDESSKGESTNQRAGGRGFGAIYVGTRQASTDEMQVRLLQNFARLVGIAAAAVEFENLTKTVQRLETEQQWIHSIMQSVADPIVLTNFDNEILLQNQRAQDLLSATGDMSEGRLQAVKMNDLLFSAYLSSASVASHHFINRDLTLVDIQEGSDLQFEVVSTPAVTDDGEQIGLVSVFRDVTDLRRASEELEANFRRLQETELEARRGRDRLELIIESVGEPVVVSDTHGSFLLSNSRAQHFFEVEDSGDFRAVAAVRSNSVKLTSLLSTLATETSGSRKEEFELIEPTSGKPVPMELTATKVPDEKGMATAIVCILHDLTHLRELERRRLEHKLFESEKLAAVGRVAASIAHEVNNPLEAIKNSLYLLQSASLAESNRKFLSIALQETERVSRIIQQMLGLARRTEGSDWVNLNQLLEETLLLFETKLKKSGIDVTCQLASDLPYIQAFADQLRQVFLNLILNAQEAIDEKGGMITIQTKPVRIARRSAVSVEFSDNGRGISPENLGRIFEPFFSTRKKGTGLGLWVTQDIVQRHGGKIEVVSTIGKGTSFQILLPVDSPGLKGRTAVQITEAEARPS